MDSSEPQLPLYGQGVLSSTACLILSPPSPFFDVLWPIIVEVADLRTQRVLARTSRYFRPMAKRAEARTISAMLKSHYLRPPAFGFTRNLIPLRLDPQDSQPLWYAWWASPACFYYSAALAEFWGMADVNPAEGFEWVDSEPRRSSHPQWCFVSSTGDVCIICLHDPREPSNHVQRMPGMHPSDPRIGTINAGQIQCIGEREKVLKLQDHYRRYGGGLMRHESDGYVPPDGLSRLAGATNGL